MTKELFSLHIADVSAFARSLGQALRQALRAVPALAVRAASHAGPATVPAPTLTDTARRALAQFDDQGRLMRWPLKFPAQRLVMWVLWTRIDAKLSYADSEINVILKSANSSLTTSPCGVNT